MSGGQAVAETRSSWQDWRSIHDLIVGLTYALDGADWETMRASIEENVTWSSASQGEHAGIEGWLETQQPGRARLARAQHMVSSLEITVNGDRAKATTYMHGVAVPKDYESRMTRIVGFYHDEFVKRDGRWRISARRFERVWSDAH